MPPEVPESDDTPWIRVPGAARVAAYGRALHAAARASDSYGLLLVLLLVDYLLLAGVAESRWVFLVRTPFIVATLLLALHTSHASHRLVRVGQLGVVFGVVAAGLSVARHGGGLFQGIAAFVLMGLLIVTPFAILRRILDQERVGSETVLGALCVYVLIGLVFAFAFMAVTNLTEEPVIERQRTANPERVARKVTPDTSPDLLYLSFASLTTAGFGDVTPATNVARAMIVLEALIGQIFLVTLVARLVAMWGASIRGDRPDPVER